MCSSDLIPDTYKPDPEADGAGVATYLRLTVEVANAAEAFAPTVDDSTVMATRAYVDEASVGSLLYSWEHFC